MISNGFIFSKIRVVFNNEIDEMLPVKSIIMSISPANFVHSFLFNRYMLRKKRTILGKIILITRSMIKITVSYLV